MTTRNECPHDRDPLTNRCKHCEKLMRHPDVPKWLFSECIGKPICRTRDCADAVKLRPDINRWYITMGHCGFNTQANNALGYDTETDARADMVAHGQGHYWADEGLQRSTSFDPARDDTRAQRYDDYLASEEPGRFYDN